MGSFVEAWDSIREAIKEHSGKIGIDQENIKMSGPDTVFSAKLISVWCEIERSEQSEGGTSTRLLSAYVGVSGDSSQKFHVRYASAMTYGRRVQRVLEALRISGNTPVRIEEPETIDADKATFCVTGIKVSWRFSGKEPWEDES